MHWLQHALISLWLFIGIIQPVPPQQLSPSVIDALPVVPVVNLDVATTTPQKPKVAPKPSTDWQTYVAPIIVPAPAPVTPQAAPETRYYTNAQGQITTEDGTVLWSPPAPTPATTLASQASSSPSDQDVPYVAPAPPPAPVPLYVAPTIPNNRNGDGSLKKPCPPGVFYQNWCI